MNDDETVVCHSKSCYADLFVSLAAYKERDREYDLTAARDHLESLVPAEKSRLHEALLPYGPKRIVYSGFVVVDAGTIDDDDVRVLAKRRHEKNFDVELIGIEDFPGLVGQSWSRLEAIRASLGEGF